MKVKELIEKLKEFDPDLPVIMNLGFDGIDDLKDVDIDEPRECWSAEQGFHKTERAVILL